MKTSANISKWLVISIFIVLAAAISSNAQPSDCTPLPAGLVSLWKAESNGLDSVGGNTAYAALLPGGVTFGPGEVGRGFQLNDTNAYLMVPASPSLNVGTGTGLTIEGWIKVASVDGLHPIAEWYADVRDQLGVQFWINSSPSESGKLLAVLIDTNSNRQALTSPSGILQPNVFQHVALTYDQTSGVTKIYINGAAAAEANMGSFVPQTSYNLWIGHRPFDAPGDWTYGATLGGVLDEFSLYNRALSSNEIAGIYNAGAAGKCGATSSEAAPIITHQPTNQTVAAGGNATFTVTATGSTTLYYQWYGPASALIPGATTSTLTLSNVQPDAAGAYFVQVTNQFGFAVSSNAVLTVTGGSSSNSCTPPPSGLVSWWKGENNTLDTAGSNNGLIVGGPISYSPGKVGNAFHYDDTTGYVEVPPTPSLNVGQGPGFTLEAWIQPDDIQDQLPVFEWEYNTNTDANGAHFWISAIGGAGCLFANIVDSSNTSHWIYSAPGLITTDYQHIALTYDKSSGVASIYRNGILVASQNLGSFTPNTTGNLLLGERTYLDNAQQFHYVGGLDEMSLYSRALSQSEIAALYQAGSGGKCGGTISGLAPVITSQPANRTVAVGGNASFSVTATGSQPLHYQWYGPGSALIPGATVSTLTLSNVQPANAGAYFVFVTNSFGFAQSSNAVLTVSGSGPAGTELVVPNYSVSNQVYNPAGSLNQPLRMQMIYGASEFPSHPIVITEIRWRPDVNAGGPLSIIVSNLQIKLSTTKATPDHLSTVFAQNTGPDETIAFNGAANVSTAFSTLGNGTKAFDLTLPLQTPFTYDPSQGDLLVDLRNLYGCIPARTTQYNIVNSTGENDAVSRVFSIDPNATTAETADTGGDVLEIIYTNTAGTTVTGPLITKQPTNQTVNAGNNAIFSVTATGSPTLHYQWFGPSNNFIPGAISSTLILSNVQPSAAGAYFVQVTNQFGFATSSNATLTVNGGTSSNLVPVITHQPTNQTVNVGGNAIFSVTATGSPTLHYQWFGPSNNFIPGAISSTLILSNVQPSAAGAYFVQVTNQFGFTISSNAVLTVTGGGGGSNTCTPPPSDMAAWWPAEGNGLDIVGGATATLHGGATFAPGEVGQAFLLNGTNDYLTATNSSLDVAAASGSLTVEAWIKVSDVAAYHPIVEWNDGSGNSGPHLWILPYSGETAGVLFANMVDTNGVSHSFHSPGGSVSPNVFQHVALTYDRSSGIAAIYVNGNIVAQSQLGSFTPKTYYPFLMGYRPGIATTEPTYGAHLGGLLDELSLYRRALNQSEIAAIYNAGMHGKCAPSNLGTAPLITHQPTNRTVVVGGIAGFSATATGSAPLHYQWYGPGSTLIPGATASTLTLSNVQPANAGAYFVFVTNSFGFAQSSNALLTVTGTAPVITGQPTNQTVSAGANAAFTVTATGTPPLHYQWYASGETLISGATAATLVLSNVQPADAGSYFVLVTNQLGFAVSSNAVLTVNGGSGSNSCTPPSTNIAAWWPAEGNGNDIIGGSTATLHGGATFAPGEVSQAFLLNATNDYLTATSSNLNIAADGSLTVEAWIKVSDVAGYHPIVEWNDNSGHAGVHLWILPYSGETAGVIFANLVDTGGVSHSFHSLGGAVSANVFQHVALTYDHSSGMVTLYVNGSIVAQSNFGQFMPQTSFPLWIGHRPNDVPGDGTYGAYLGGLLDELSLYRRALSQSEIAAIYNAGANGKCPVTPMPHSASGSQPIMNLSFAANSPVLSWPAWAGDCILQAADGLTDPIKWTNVPLTFETNSDNIRVTLPTRDRQGFFRLVHP